MLKIRGLILSDQRGFTLVEVMSAAAIVGVLSAVAIPNYLSYTASSRQAEAKIALSSIYSAELNYATEAGIYTSCLSQLGYAPEANSQQYYIKGFSSNVYNASSCGTTGVLPCNIYNSTTSANCTTTGNYQFAPNAKSGAAMASDTQLQTMVTNGWLGLGSTGFSAGAAGSISPTNSNYDYWYITHKKALLHSASGI